MKAHQSPASPVRSHRKTTAAQIDKKKINAGTRGPRKPQSAMQEVQQVKNLKPPDSKLRKPHAPMGYAGLTILVCGDPTQQPTESKASAVNVLVPATTTHPQRSCQLMSQEARAMLLAQGEPKTIKG